jgi:molecular chaperone GrpE
VASKDPTRTQSANKPERSQTQAPGQVAQAAEATAAAGKDAGQETAPGEAGAEAAEVAINHEAELLRKDLEQMTDRALRAQAELENYRRRIARQMEDERRYASLPLLRDLLPVLDNVRRAIEAAQRSPEVGGLLEGFRMVARQLEEVLTRHQCKEIVALGAPFDPHLHEAISQQPSAEHAPGTVLLVTQSGFQLHDRVVRPSQVIVSSAPPEPTGDH